MAPQSRSNTAKVGTNRLVQLLGQWADGDGPLYHQLAGQVASLIGDGSLRAGDRLPPERSIAEALAVSRGTVVRAFESLAEAGKVERIQGSGTTVLGNNVRSGDRAGEFVGERLWSADGATIDLLKAIPRLLPEVAGLAENIDLTAHAGDLDGAEPLGWWRLRQTIADLHNRQGLTTTPHQIMVTSGAQQAISLVVSAMVSPGDVVLGEDDTWPGLIDCVQNAGARYEPVRMDDQGILVEDLAVKIDRYRPTLIALNPQHQNPTGSRLPADRVAAVAELARRSRTIVLEDRVAADLGFDRRRLPYIDDTGTAGHGITIGSICKVAWPGLRLGWLRADAQVVHRLRSHKAVADMFAPALSQLLGIQIVERYEEFVDARLAQLRPAADLVVEVLRRDLPDWRFQPPRGGLSVWVTLPGQASAAAFAQHAAHHGVMIASGREFCPNNADCANVRIPYTAELPVLAEGMARLVDAWHSFDRQPVAAGVI